MIKMRVHWPKGFNQAMADALREQRSLVVDVDNPLMVNLEAAAAIREMNRMMGKVEARVIEDDEINNLQSFWVAWIEKAR